MFLSLIKSGIGYKEPTRFRRGSGHMRKLTKLEKMVLTNPTDHSQKGQITTVSEEYNNTISDYWSSEELHEKASRALANFSK